MRVPKLIFVLPAVCLLTGCSGCTEQTPVPQGPTPASAPGADEIRVEIPLDATEVVDVSNISGLVRRNFRFIIDGSGSMSVSPPSEAASDRSFGTKLEGAKWAVREFMNHVPEEVNLGLWVFDDNGSREVVPLGPSNRHEFLAAVEAIESGGLTPLAEAIREGVDCLVAQYKRQLGYGEYRLIVVTDGEADDIPQAAAYAEKYGIPIYTIGFCVGPDHPLKDFSVSYRVANSAEDLRKGLQEAVAELETFDPTEFEGL